MTTGDAARPSDEKFSQVLQKSLGIWSSYLVAGSENDPLPRHALDLKPLVSQTPPYLGDGLATFDKTVSFACEEKQSMQTLVVHGRSTWRTSKGSCDLPPRVLPKQLILAVGGRLDVVLSEYAPLSVWPGVQGLSGNDEGNYLSVLFFAWAYILSARWVELLGRSADHECHMAYIAPEVEDEPPHLDQQPKIQIDIGDDACNDEVLWWYAILCSDKGWDATTKYNGRLYFSPWSVSAKNVRFTLATKAILNTDLKPPSSSTALKYLSRFCAHHRLYAQCSVALAGTLYIPFLGGTVRLPFPKQVSRLEITKRDGDSSISIPDLLEEHDELLPRYMTLSSNVWGLRSLLHSTFFDPDIECNLVSAWLNPAFAILGSISPRQRSLATFLANRQPRLGILWLGAIFTDRAKSVLRDIRAGMTALDILTSAWTGTTQTFLTSKTKTSNGGSIRRDDECRLLFITACEAQHRPPVWPWKPFGVTQLCDTELPVRQHAQCGVHCLEYESWEWMLTNDCSIQVPRGENVQNPHRAHQTPHPASSQTSVALGDYDYDFFSQSLSEVATRGIFGWLRSTGYPRCERPLYQHSWIDLEGTDEEEAPDDPELGAERQRGFEMRNIDSWLDGVSIDVGVGPIDCLALSTE